jgi:Amt family ammonium transporter
VEAHQRLSPANFYGTVKFWLRIDDSLDIFAEHAVGGILGLFFNSLFGADYIIGLDGVNTGVLPGGWLNHNYAQMYIQVAYIVAATGYSFVMSALIAWLINLVPGLHLRASDEAELLGMDDDQLGEFAYDYVEVRRDYLAWTPSTTKPLKDGEPDADLTVEPSRRHGIPQHGNMIEGRSPSDDGSGRYKGGAEHTGIQGDRHGQAVSKKEEDQEREKEKQGNGDIF